MEERKSESEKCTTHTDKSMAFPSPSSSFDGLLLLFSQHNQMAIIAGIFSKKGTVNVLTSNSIGLIC